MTRYEPLESLIDLRTLYAHVPSPLTLTRIRIGFAHEVRLRPFFGSSQRHFAELLWLPLAAVF